MKKRILGTVNPLEVSAIGYGCMGFSHGYGKCPDRETAISLMRAAYDRGCTFFDTAQSYADGENEILVGEAVKPFRNNIVLATKIHIPEEAKNNLGQVLESRLDASLRRLGTDYVDIFYQHRMNESISAEEVAYEMGLLIAKGKIRGYGQSQSTAHEIIRANAVTPMTAVQCEYSIMERSFEKEVIPTCEKLGIGFVAFSPMASGYLSGKAITPNNTYRGDDVRRVITRYSPENVRANLPLLDALSAFAEKKHATTAQISLAWLLGKKPFIVPIPGMRSLERIEENLGAADVELTAADMAELEDILSGIKIYGNRTDEDIRKLKIMKE